MKELERNEKVIRALIDTAGLISESCTKVVLQLNRTPNNDLVERNRFNKIARLARKTALQNLLAQLGGIDNDL